MTVITLLHPGAMGASEGAALVGAGRQVRWVGEGRSAETRARAADAGFEEVGDLGTALDGSDAVVSVVPPANAIEVAGAVYAAGFGGIYVDANAVSPATIHEIEAVFDGAGGATRVVDGGIVGPPAWRLGTTRLALSGPSAPEVASWFEATPLEPLVVGEQIGKASAFKMAFAAWTKGTSALALVLDAFADAHGLGPALSEEWGRRDMDVVGRIEAARVGAVPKAWRFGDEMREIATALTESGLPDGWFQAAGAAYDRLASFKDRFEDPPTAEEVRRDLRRWGG